MRAFILSLLFIITVGTSTTYAHGGRLDKNGGHYNRKTGEYHYHRGHSSGYGWLILVAIGGVIIYAVNKKDKK